jgi:hypothetical protein
MAKKPDGKPASVDRVSFTRPAAERIGKAVRLVEAGDRDLGPIEWGPRGGGGGAGKVFRVCTFTGAWAVDTAKVVTFRNVTTTPNTAYATNFLISLPARAQSSSSRICNIAKDGTAWYLVSFQMTTATAVFSDRTQTMTFVGTGATQTITYASLGSSVSALTDLSASLNTTDCTITVNKTTASFRIVGQTQTATVISMSGTQTAVISTGTYTATFISLEL